MSRITALLATSLLALSACSDDGDPNDTDAAGSETTAATDTEDTDATDTEDTDATDTEDTDATDTEDTDSTDTDSTDTDTDSTDTDEPMEIDCEVDAWDIAADQQWKSAWMAACMIPAIEPIMQGIDAEKYASLTCAHCHGEDLGGGTFAMPATIELNWADAAMWPPEYFDGNTFMGPMSDVVVAAADAMGYEPYDPMTMEGFGCGGCHVGL